MAELDYISEYNFKRLAKEGETCWDDILKRFINEMVKRGAKTSKEDLEWLLLNYYALPNSPALHTAGNKKFYASACSSYPIVDSMDEGEFSILNTLKISSMATKAGIGTGFNFSNLRSKEEPVQGKPNTTGGPVSFLRAINGFVREISQATRKSAAMGTISVHHPDIIDFVTCKTKDGTIENFNLSVLLSDEFMEAVEQKKTYAQIFPNTKETREVDAKEIFDLIAQNAYNSGEPGMLFTGNIKKDYFTTIDDNHILNNPCFTGDTLIVTDRGLFPIEDLVGQRVKIHNGLEWQEIDNFRVTGEGQEILKITLEDGSEIKVTPHHSMILEDRTRVEAKDLKIGMQLKGLLPETSGEINEKGAYLKGFLIGDGNLQGNNPQLHLYSPKYCCKDRLISSANELEIENIKATYLVKDLGFIANSGGDRENMQGLTPRRKELMPYCSYYKKGLPREIFRWNYSSKYNFIAGLFDADGTSQDSESSGFMYQVASIEKTFLLDLQTLLKTIGVRSKLSLTRKSGQTNFNDGYGEYKTKDCYRLTINQAHSIKLANRVSFERLKDFSNKEIKNNIALKHSTIKSIEKQEELEDKVYCCTVEGSHSLAISTGNLCGNCSEALLSYNEGENPWIELCVLASINLPKFMELEQKHKTKVVYLTVSMLNDIILVQDYVTPLQSRGMRHINRKIGIGVAGLATILAKQNIKYSSTEAKDLTRNIFKFIGDAAKVKSEDMYEKRDEDNEPWMMEIDKESPLRNLKRYNASLLSVAPTSSISNIFNDMNEEGCSYGIEPYFTLETYKLKNSFGEFEKREKIIDFIGEEKAKTIIECANDLDYKAHLGPVEAYYEAHWMKGITQACSKTINFKNNVTVEEVKEAIMYCWKNKIKGISFYRDGSRKNQVISTKDTYKEEVDAKGRPTRMRECQSPKRPEYLDVEIHHVTSEKEKWLVLVGMYKGPNNEDETGRPYEVFAGSEEMISIPKKHKIGKIKKGGGYHLIVGEGDDELVIKDIPAAFKNPQYATLTRMISSNLRHGGPLKYLVEQLQKEGGFDAINKAIARMLKKHIPENESTKEKCPNCSGALVYISGCPTCTGNKELEKAPCGYSRCS